MIEESAEVLALRAKMDAQITEGAEGALVVKFTEPVKIGASVRATLTVRRVTLGDMREVNRAGGSFDVLSDRLVEPKDAHLAITNEFDAALVARATGRQLEKYLRSGA